MAKHAKEPEGLLKLGAQLAAAARLTYHFGRFVSYVTGIVTVKWLSAFWQMLMYPLRAVGRLASTAWDFLVLRRWQSLCAEGRHLIGGFRLAGERVRAARLRGLWIAAVQVLALPWLALRRHRKVLARVGNVLMPIAASLVLLAVINYWSHLSFGLSLEYEGHDFGCITDEQVFDAAAAMVNSRVCAAEDEELQVRTPKLTLTVVSEQEVLDEATVCDKIIESSGDEFAEATGLYLNGELVGAVTSAEELDDLLEEHLSAWRSNGTAEFVQAVTSQNGLFPIAKVVTPARLKSMLNDTANGARRLQVRVTAVSESEEEIPYTTSTINDAESYEGSRVVTTEGQNGARLVTRQTVSVDGEVQSVTELASTVIREPVEEVVRLGTKKYNEGGAYTSGVAITEGDGVVTGAMLWPVPAVHRVYQSFHGGHSGIDISGGKVTMMNTPIVAADGGTVKEVNTNPNVGYGIYVVIDHGNGLTTMYAHLNSVSVTTNQRVTRGQEIGRGGTTGWSTGPHLHFEVRVNGSCVNPLNYVS